MAEFLRIKVTQTESLLSKVTGEVPVMSNEGVTVTRSPLLNMDE